MLFETDRKPTDVQDLPKKLDFEGAHNFRDLGGYPLLDDRRVKPGRLFRSDHLGRLTAAVPEIDRPRAP